MSSENPGKEREQLEATLTALLLGELSAEEAAALTERISQDPELRQLYRQLEASVALVREAARKSPEEIRQANLRLSDARREKLLQQFRSVKLPQARGPKEWESRWLVPVGLAAVLTVIAAGLMLPALSKAKFKSAALSHRELLRAEVRSTGQEQEQLEKYPQAPAVNDSLMLNVGKPALAAIQPERKPAAYGGNVALADKSPAAGPVPGVALALPIEPPVQSKELASPETPARGVAVANQPLPVARAKSERMLRFGGSSSLDTAAAKAKPSSSPAPSSASAGDVALFKNSGDLSAGNFSRRSGGSVYLPHPTPPTSAAEAAPAGNYYAGRAMSGPSQETQPSQYGKWFFDESAGKQDRGPKDKAGLATTPVLGDIPTLGKLFVPEGGGIGGAAGAFGIAGAATTAGLEQSKIQERLADSKGTVQEARQRQVLLEPNIVSFAVSDFDADGAVRLQSNLAGGLEGKLPEKVAETTNLAMGFNLYAGDAKQAVDSLGRTDRSNVLLSSIDRNEVEERQKKITEAQPEIQTRENPFSTFSLNVSDVSFKLAAASLNSGKLPDASSIRTEEFINALDYRDPAPAPGAPVSFVWERAAYPFAQNRDLLRLAIKTAAQGRAPGQALNITLLLDNSGSMERADRVRIIREALRVLGTQLRPEDKLSIVTFARRATLKADGIPGNNAPQALEEISKLTPEGGTNLEEAMRVAYETALRHYQSGGNNRVVLLTDGAANLGEVRPEPLKQTVEAHRKKGIALDCFGIGWEGYNDDLLEVLSRNGDGRYGFINSPESAGSEFAGQLAGAFQVAASDVKVQVEFNPARVNAYRQWGYAKHQLTKEQFRDNTVDAAELGAAESGNALYTLDINSSGAGPIGSLRVRYKVPGTAFYHEHEWAIPYTGSATLLDRAGPAMRMAATAGAFSEWLAGSPYATEVSLARLQELLRGIPEQWGADSRPKTLETMIQQAQRIAGK